MTMQDISKDSVFEALFEDNSFYLSPLYTATTHRYSTSLDQKLNFKTSETSFNENVQISPDPSNQTFKELHRKVNNLFKTTSETRECDIRPKPVIPNEKEAECSALKQFGLSDLETFRLNLKEIGKNPFKHFHFSIKRMISQANQHRTPLADCTNAYEKLNASAKIICACWYKFVYRSVYIYLRNLINCYNKMSPSLLRFTNPNEASLVIDPAVGTQLRFKLGGTRFPPLVMYRIYTTCPVVCVHFRNKKGKARHTGRCRETRQHSKDFNCWRPWKDRYSTFSENEHFNNTKNPLKRKIRRNTCSKEKLSLSRISSEASVSGCLSDATFIEDSSLSGVHPSKQFESSRSEIPNNLHVTKLVDIQEEEQELLNWVKNI